jgi:hypothetical protein
MLDNYINDFGGIIYYKKGDWVVGRSVLWKGNLGAEIR